MNTEYVENKLKKLKSDLIGKTFKLRNFDEPLSILDVKIKVGLDRYTTYVKFMYSNDYETIEMWYRYGEVLRDRIRNYLKIGKWGTYLGKYGTRDEFDLYVYKIWKHIHERCNDHIVYDNTTICREWMGFSHFFEWVKSNESNYLADNNQQIDKDILQWGSKYKIYSPHTCVFIPTYLNKYLSGLSKRTLDRTNDSYVALRLNSTYLYITAKEVNKRRYLFNYCRYYVFDRLIKYYLDAGKITPLIFTRLSMINLEINNIVDINTCKKELPISVKIKMNNFINEELSKLKIRENEVCSETRVL